MKKLSEMQENSAAKHVQPLDTIIRESVRLQQIYKSQLRYGDIIAIWTQNSVYSIGVLAKGTYLISGGWFDKQGLSPKQLCINGCTWGGSVIKADIIAARGLCLEFANGVVTSPIQEFKMFRL